MFCKCCYNLLFQTSFMLIIYFIIKLSRLHSSNLFGNNSFKRNSTKFLLPQSLLELYSLNLTGLQKTTCEDWWRRNNTSRREARNSWKHPWKQSSEEKQLTAGNIFGKRTLLEKRSKRPLRGNHFGTNAL